MAVLERLRRTWAARETDTLATYRQAVEAAADDDETVDPSQVVALRLTSEELAELDARAARAHKTRSELIRDALAAYAA